MGQQEKFQQLINQESVLFHPICSMMRHSKVNEGRNFLCAMNNLVDHYCAPEREGNAGINYKIVYVPTCPDWGRELLARYLIHKIAFTSSDRFYREAKLKVERPLFQPLGVTGKKFELLREERKYLKTFVNRFKNKLPDSLSGNRSLFVVQDKDIITRKQDKNPWLESLYSDDIINPKGNAIVTTSLSAFDLEKILRKNKGKIKSIENVFIFHSQNRGKMTFSYNIDQLERLNQYGLAIRNCFVFYITNRPFRLYFALDNVKNALSSNLLHREVKRFDDFDGFITFTPEELDLMFHRNNNRTQYIIDSPEREIVTADIDSFFDELPHNYRIKNSLSLAFSIDTQNAFLEECELELGVSQPKVLRPFLDFYKQLWYDEIYRRIKAQIANYHSVAFVVPSGVSRYYMSALCRTFSDEYTKVCVANFDELRDGLSVDYVVLFSFRYTDARYKTYPNSFDPIPLKNGQKGMTIINRLTHNRYYEWNRHFYDKDYNGLLYSSFRKECLGWSKKQIQRPIMPDIISNIDEAESDARDYMAEKCTILFDIGKIKRLSADRVIFREGNHYGISSLKEFPFEEGVQIQMLDELVEQIKVSLIKKTDNNLKSEDIIRRDPAYGLTEDQIKSGIELWKFLLKRKVEQLGVESTYEAIFPVNKEISRRGFERWLDFDYPMILPRSRKSQNSLLRFLGFELGSIYHRIILTKKLLKNSNTRLLNSQIESLLQSILTVPSIKDKDFGVLFDEHSEILTLLEINSASEVNTLVELLDISLKPVKSITYDSDKA